MVGYGGFVLLIFLVLVVLPLPHPIPGNSALIFLFLAIAFKKPFKAWLEDRNILESKKS